MDERSFSDGEILFNEGDESDFVYLIRTGKIDVIKTAGNQSVLLAVCGSGEILGEMGIIRNELRSTSCRARGPATALVIDKQEFLGAFNTGNKLALKVLRILCRRLQDTSQALADKRLDVQGSRVNMDKVESILLLPESSEVRQQIGTNGTTVEKLPFRVGRRLISGETGHHDPCQLILHNDDSPHLSPTHFAIEENAKKEIVIRDLDSYLGTVVNGERISRFEENQKALLHIGPNVVIAGGDASPFRFSIVIEPVS